MRIYFLAILLLASCGKFEEKFGRLNSDTTSVKISWRGNESLNAALPGIMVYAVRADNPESRASRFMASESSTSEWVIPNGVYNFYSVGYATAGLTGNMYCGRDIGVALSGGSVTVTIEMDATSQCGTPPFSPSGYENGGQPKTLWVGFCHPSTGNMGSTSFSGVCDGTSGRPTAGSATGITVSLEEYVKWDPNQTGMGLPNPLKSGCIAGAFIGNPVTTSIVVPYGTPFVTEITAFTGGNCTTYAGSYLLFQGIANAGDNSRARFRNAADNLVNPALQMMNSAFGGGVITRFYLRNY